MHLHLDSVDPLQAEGKLARTKVPYSHPSTPSTKGRIQETSKHFQLLDSLVRNWVSRPGLCGVQLAHCPREGQCWHYRHPSGQSTVCTFTQGTGLEALLFGST